MCAEVPRCGGAQVRRVPSGLTRRGDDAKTRTRGSRFPRTLEISVRRSVCPAAPRVRASPCPRVFFFPCSHCSHCSHCFPFLSFCTTPNIARYRKLLYFPNVNFSHILLVDGNALIFHLTLDDNFIAFLRQALLCEYPDLTSSIL